MRCRGLSLLIALALFATAGFPAQAVDAGPAMLGDRCVERAAACDEVWLAVAASTKGRDRDRRVKRLCRLIGVGLLSVLANGYVEIVVAPEPWKPRPDRKRRSRLLAEHRRRQGDPTAGGSTLVPLTATQ